jgi:hypothetical protein
MSTAPKGNDLHGWSASGIQVIGLPALGVTCPPLFLSAVIVAEWLAYQPSVWLD